MSQLNLKVIKPVALEFDSVARRNRFFYQRECDLLNQTLKPGDQIDGFIRNIVPDLRCACGGQA
jgi:hypothetical protein